jgi:DNA-binding MarR family transcriptional regulator
MAKPLQEEIRQQRPFGSLEEEAFLSLQRTANLLLQALGRELRGHELSPAQYNLLRILRGAGSEALTCGEIAERLVSPGPDVTRLLDRLEARQLVFRERDSADRRVVRARITGEGSRLLAEIDPRVDAVLKRLLGHLGDEGLRQLSKLLEQARERT